MEKRILTCFLLMCFFCFSIPKVVFGQSPESPAEQVFDEYRENLFKRPGILKVLPDALRTFREVGMNRSFRDSFLANPRFLLGVNIVVDNDFTDEFISLLTVDEDLRALFSDEQFYEVLTDPTEIVTLIEIIEAIQLPTTLEIVSGNGQSGNPDTILQEPFVVVVKDQNGEPVDDIDVVFAITMGNGNISTKNVPTSTNGRAQTYLTLRPNEGINEVIATVKGTSLTVTFIAVAITTDNTVNPPLILEIVSGNEQKSEINTILPQPFIVKVSDQDGKAVPGVDVILRILYDESGESSLQMVETDDATTNREAITELPVVTDDKGLAIIKFKLGKAPGYTLIEASVDGAKPVIFTATATTPITPQPDINTPKPPEPEVFVNITPSIIISPAMGKRFTLNVNIKGGENINGYVITMKYDPTALGLKLKDDNGNLTFNGKYLPDAYPLIISESNESVNPHTVTLATASPSESSGDGVLAKLTFEVVELKESTLELVDVKLSTSEEFLLTPNFDNNPVIVKDYDANVDGIGEVNVLDLVKVGQCFGKTTGDCSAADVNEDGNIDILDLAAVVRAMGVSEDPSSVPEDVNGEEPPTVPEDVNGDGVVNILDIAAVAAAVEDTGSAPSIHDMEQFNVSAKDVQTWLTQAKAFNPNISETTIAHPDYQRGIAMLENLLATLTQTAATPQKTALLLNYPNPFNPETWIPYQLAEATDVTVTIHSMNGSLIRTLSLGHQSAGLYRSKSRAAYWDGKNEFGEQVASGLYFYTLTAGRFSATGKMLIRK